MCRKHYHYAWTHGLIPVKAHVAGHGDGEAFIRESLMVETDECIWNVKTGRTWSWLTGIKRKAA